MPATPSRKGSDAVALSEAAYWMAALSGEGAQRQAAKEALYAWCVQALQSASALFALDAQALAAQSALTLQQAQDLLLLGGLSPEIERALSALRAWGVQVITRADVSYPEELAARLPEKWLPYTLACKGDLAILTEPGVAVLGAAQPTAEQEQAARQVAQALVAQGRHLVGGYDRGVDRLGLEAASALGGRTTLVLPLGIRHCRALLEADAAAYAEGRRLVLSPYPLDAPLREAQERARRALVMALCDTVFLIAPDAGPEGWPQATELMRGGLQVRYWGAAESEATRAWAEAGAVPFEARELTVAAGGCEAPHTAAEGEALPGEALHEEAPPIAFGSVEEAIQVLGKSGRVPERLIGRLRDAAAFYDCRTAGGDEP